MKVEDLIVGKTHRDEEGTELTVTHLDEDILVVKPNTSNHSYQPYSGVSEKYPFKKDGSIGFIPWVLETVGWTLKE